MQFLYLDDSGSKENENEQYFVLGGICVPEKSVRWLSNKLTDYAKTFDPDPDKVEFHASEIFRGEVYPWNTMKDKLKRIEIIKNVLCILDQSKIELPLFAYAQHKKSFPKDDPVSCAYESLSGKFEMHLSYDLSTKDNCERGMIILDKSSHETIIQELSKNFRATGNRWGDQLRHIIEIPLFCDSEASRIIQYADHVAYAVFRRYNANDINYFNCIQDKFSSKDGVIHGLVHKQKFEKCTCPACITRPRN